ncbi:MAG: 6-bladed beta-propeller [Acidobacteria bacterium]|jgi:hypothetical protein|nr:6-bladed beta-propeller [Acidobacteriota bacterium]
MNKASAVLVLALIPVIAVVPACKGKPGPSEPAYPVRIETVDGVRTVLDPAFPKEGVVRYALREELSVGGESGGAEAVLNRPQYLDVDAQGNLYVLDWGDVDIKVFAPDGRLLRKFGKQGQGPGEFDIPVRFAVEADGGVVLLSGRQHQVIFLDAAGKYVSSFRVDGFCDQLGLDGRGRIYYSQFLTPDEAGGGGEEYKLVQNRMALFRTDRTGREKTRLGEFLDVTMMRKTQGQMISSMSSREAYTTSWHVGPDERVYLGYNKDYRLDVYDADWKLLFRFGRETTPVRHPQYKAGGPHPEFYPAFSDWHSFFDGEGNLWLEQYVEEGVEDKVYDVFTPEGIYLKQVRVPETLHLVRGDAAYSIIRQEDEFLVVKRFRLVPEKWGT